MNYRRNGQHHASQVSWEAGKMLRKIWLGCGLLVSAGALAGAAETPVAAVKFPWKPVVVKADPGQTVAWTEVRPLAARDRGGSPAESRLRYNGRGHVSGRLAGGRGSGASWQGGGSHLWLPARPDLSRSLPFRRQRRARVNRRSHPEGMPRWGPRLPVIGRSRNSTPTATRAAAVVTPRGT